MTSKPMQSRRGWPRRWLPAGLALMLSASWLQGSFSNGKEYSHKQPDGSVVKIRVFGDEHYRRMESTDGYTLVVDPSTKFLSYARRNAEGTDLVSTERVYTGSILKGASLPLDLSKHESLGRDQIRKLTEDSRSRQKELLQTLREERQAESLLTAPLTMATLAVTNPLPGSLENRQSPVIGDLTGLTVLVDFPDQLSKVSRQELDDFMNKPGYTGFGNNGSVRDYFYDISRGKLNYTNKVVGFCTTRHARNWYSDRISDLLTEIIDYVEASGIDLSDVSLYPSGRAKAINILYYGDRNPRPHDDLWPHVGSIAGGPTVRGVRLSSFQISDLGDLDSGSAPDLDVVVHENGHMICNWSDAYDGDDNCNESAGTGKWDVMAYDSPRNPEPPNPYYRFLSGWETFTELTPAANGQYQILFPNSNESLIYYNYSRTSSHEFFILESVFKTGRRSEFPGDGLLVWHVDSLGSNNYQQMTPSEHYEVSLEQADGRFDLEKLGNRGDATDPFKGTGLSFSSTSTPNSKWWNGTNSDLCISNINSYGSEFTFQIIDTTAPTAPTNLTGYMPRFMFNACHLSWSPSTDQMGVTAYDIYANGTLVGTTSTTDFEVTGLRYLTRYQFTVRARDARGNTSAPSTPFAYMTAVGGVYSVPTPTNLRYTDRSFTTVTLAWTASAPTPVSSEFDYEIYDQSYNLLGTTRGTSLVLTKLAADTTHTFLLVARVPCTYGDVSYPCSLDVTTLKDTLPPTAPSQLGIYMGGVTMTTASLYWMDAVDNVKVTSYEVYTRGVKLATFPAYRYQVLKNLTPGTTYDLTVVARDAAGNGSVPSNVLTITTPSDTSDPTAPSGLGLYMGGVFKSGATASASLNWAPSTDNSGIKEYVVYCNGVEKGVAPAQSNRVYYTVQGLPLDTTCAITVRSRDLAGRLSGPSNTLTINTDLTAPTAPTSLACALNTVTASTADITWANTSTDNLGVTLYKVLANGKEMGSVTPAPAGTMGYRITKLLPNKAYTLAVVAVDAAGNTSLKSNTVSVTTLPDTTAPSAPTQLGIYMGGVTATTASLRWVASTDDVAVLGYDIYNGSILLRSIPASGSVVYYTMEKLVPNTTYVLTVRSWNAAGLSSAPSNSLTIKTAAQ